MCAVVVATFIEFIATDHGATTKYVNHVGDNAGSKCVFIFFVEVPPGIVFLKEGLDGALNSHSRQIKVNSQG